MSVWLKNAWNESESSLNALSSRGSKADVVISIFKLSEEILPARPAGGRYVQDDVIAPLPYWTIDPSSQTQQRNNTHRPAIHPKPCNFAFSDNTHEPLDAGITNEEWNECSQRCGKKHITTKMLEVINA